MRSTRRGDDLAPPFPRHFFTHFGRVFRAVSAGGESGNPASPHFGDQAVRYSKGDLREVYFYPSQLAGHIEREYRPGARAP